MHTRIRATLALYAFAVLGVFLVVAPWTAVWEQAALALAGGTRPAWAWSGWLRGVVSGLGLIDLGVAAFLVRDLWHDRG